MKAYDTGSIRNVAVIGHSGAGKTQLVAALLFTAGATPRLGRVDDGTSLTDYDEEEIARKHTLSASLAWAEWNKSKINIIDTPGMGNFLADARAGLRVADAALLVVDAVAGVEVQTEKVWAEAEAMGLPRLVVVSRLDRERASLDRTLTSLREFCSRTVVPIQMPLGEEKGFTGVVDLVSMKAWTFAADGSGKATEGPVPASLAEQAGAARDALIEMVAEADDALMEKFFESGTLSQEELVSGPAHCDARGQDLPAGVRLGPAQRRPAAAPRRGRRVPPLPHRPSRVGDEHEDGGDGRRDARPRRAVRGLRLEDGGRSVCGPHHALPRRHRHAEVRRQRAQPHARHDRASRPPDDDAGQDADERAGDPRRRSWRGRQVEGHAHQRHAGREERPVVCANRVSRAGPLLRHRAQEPRRRGQDQHVRCTGWRKRIRPFGTRAIRRLTSCCCRARDSSTSRSPSRS